MCVRHILQGHIRFLNICFYVCPIVGKLIDNNHIKRTEFSYGFLTTVIFISTREQNGDTASMKYSPVCIAECTQNNVSSHLKW